MSLDHSEGKQEGLEPELGVESGREDEDALLSEGWPTLADEVVPMQEQAERDLRREREERIRLVVGKRRPITRPLALGALGAVAALSLLAVLIALKQGGSNSAPDPALRTTVHRRPTTTLPSHLRASTTTPRRAHAVARDRRRAAIRARGEAARRRAKARSPRANTNPSAASQVPRSATQNELATATSPPPGPSSEAARPPAEPPPSTKRSPTQSEFGFEH